LLIYYQEGLKRRPSGSLAAAVDFYTTTLGFEIRTQIPGQAAFLRAPGSANDHDLGLFGIGGAAIAAVTVPGPGCTTWPARSHAGVAGRPAPRPAR
jgi:catechol 2,3-dioxygenase-like lactoylglutathione lyase family enzyme